MPEESIPSKLAWLKSETWLGALDVNLELAMDMAVDEHLEHIMEEAVERRRLVGRIPCNIDRDSYHRGTNR